MKEPEEGVCIEMKTVPFFQKNKYGYAIVIKTSKLHNKAFQQALSTPLMFHRYGTQRCIPAL
jgi:hypothetical protein